MKDKIMKIIVFVFIFFIIFGCATYREYNIEPSIVETIESNAELKLVTALTLFFGSFLYNEFYIGVRNGTK